MAGRMRTLKSNELEAVFPVDDDDVDEDEDDVSSFDDNDLDDEPAVRGFDDPTAMHLYFPSSAVLSTSEMLNVPFG